MHFVGVYAKRLDSRTQWAQALDRIAASGSTATSFRRWQVGPVGIITDQRLTRSSSGQHGLLINSGSLVPAGHVSVAASLEEPSRLRECLQTCRGNFAGAHVSTDGQRLIVFGDLLGTHPVYFADLDDAFAFSTSQRTLAGMLSGRLSTDVEGTLEICSFGFPLADRTAYREIRCLDAAQMRVVDTTGTAPFNYFDWRNLDVQVTDDVPALARRAHSSFSDAVRLRREPDSSNYTLLSGGMDSRSILATETSLGVHPTTLSISHPRALDAELARQAAAAFGSPFSFYPIEFSAFHSVGGVAAAVHDLLARSAPAHDTRVRIWSGDGGSVGLGGVYLSEQIVNHAAAGRFDDVADTFLAENGLAGPSPRLFAPSLEVRSFARRALLGELERFRTRRIGQIPYLFLLLNDQRRHLHYFFELDLKVPLEFVTPFWDAEFMRIVLECPDQELLYHRFYARFFEQLPAAARRVPWQTYPGHVPCPLPMPEGFEYNWGHAPRPADLADAHARARRVLRACVSSGFPSRILRRLPTAAAAFTVLMSKDPARAYLMHHAQMVLQSAAASRPGEPRHA